MKENFRFFLLMVLTTFLAGSLPERLVGEVLPVVERAIASVLEADPLVVIVAGLSFVLFGILATAPLIVNAPEAWIIDDREGK